MVRPMPTYRPILTLVIVLASPATQQREIIGAPKFFPDGKRVAFAYASAVAVPTQVHSITIDGTDERTHTADSNSVTPVGFSARGARLIYVAENRDSTGFLRDRAHRHTRIMSSNADGSDARVLASTMGGRVDFVGWWANGERAIVTTRTTTGDSAYIVSLDGANRRAIPAARVWLRDGQFATIESGPTASRIVIMNQEGGSPRPLTADVRFQHEIVAVSSDGKQIAFRGGSVPRSLAMAVGTRVFVANVDGSGGAREVLAEAGQAFNFSFSPDGSALLFEDTRNENADIYVVGADGKNERRLTTDPGNDTAPAWSPDGRHIVFQRDRFGIYLMNADGTGARRLR